MNPRFYSAALVAGILAASAYVNGACADTINYTQDPTDFTTLPSSSTNPTPSSTTGTVYAPGASGTVFGSVPGVYRSPFENVSVGSIITDGGGHALPNYDLPTLSYSSVEGCSNCSATYYAGSSGANTLTFLWGSPDAYNTLTFLDQNGNVIGSITGTGVTTGPATFNALDGLITPQTYGHDEVTFSDTSLFYSVVLSSTTNAFEFADLSMSLVPQPTPLPASLPLFASGLGVVGLLLRRRKQKAAARAA
jgi:hypothetical protein